MHLRIPEWETGTDQKIVGNGFQPIGIQIIGNCIHEGFSRKVITHRIGQIGTWDFLEFSDMNFETITSLPVVQRELFYSFLETMRVIIRLNSRYCFLLLTSL